MSDLSQVEKIIVKTLVKLNSKEELKESYDDWVNYGMDGNISIFDSVARLMSIDVNLELGVQYVRYSFEYYDSIVEGNFNNPMERLSYFDCTVNAVEIEVVSVDYSVQFHAFPSFLDEKMMDIEDNFWDYDPDRETMDYLDSSIDSMDWKSADVTPIKDEIKI